MKTITAIVSLVLMLGLGFTPSAEAQSQVLCVKKKLALKGKKVPHSSALTVVAAGGTCPSGYIPLDFQGAAGATGPTGPTGPTVTDAYIYLPGTAGMSWEDSSSQNAPIVIEPHSSSSVDLRGTTAPSGIYYYVPIPVSVVQTGLSTYVKEVSFQYRVEDATTFITNVYLRKGTGVNTDTSPDVLDSETDLVSTTETTVTLPIAASAASLIDGPLMLVFQLDIANTSHSIYLGPIRILIGGA